MELEIMEEKKMMGTIGALIGALAGGVVYFLLYQIGYVASISGLAGAFCAIWMYQKFAGKLSTYGIVISVVFSLFAILASWYLCLAYDIYDAFKDQGADMLACVMNGWSLLLDNSEVMRAYLADLAMGLVFYALGIFSAVRKFR